MNLNLNFELTTPALIFPAISLLMLAYTNRFVVLADLVRSLHENHQQKPSPQTLAQINNLQFRMELIKKMQVFGAAAFVFSALSMLCALLALMNAAQITFAIGLILLLISLFYLLKELSVSIDALKIQLNDLKETPKP